MTLGSDVLSIRDMEISDIEAVLAIDDQVYSRSWSPSFLQEQLASSRDKRVNRVAEIDGDVVAHAGMLVVVDEGHVTTVAVHPEVQGRGVGARLVAELCWAASERRLLAMTLEVRASNLRARELYRRFGFVPVGIRPNYYRRPDEDALVMWVSAVGTSNFLARVNEASTNEAMFDEVIGDG